MITATAHNVRDLIASHKWLVLYYWHELSKDSIWIEPILKEVEEKHYNVAVASYNLTRHKQNNLTSLDGDILQELAIESVPTVLIFKNGEIVGRNVGIGTYRKYYLAINKLLIEDRLEFWKEKRDKIISKNRFDPSYNGILRQIEKFEDELKNLKI